MTAALSKRFNGIKGLALDGRGALYFIHEHQVLRIVLASGDLGVVAGTGSQGFSGDGGPAKEAELFYPRGLAFDPRGNLFVSDTGNHRIRRVDGTSGIIHTIVGCGPDADPGEGGYGANAGLKHPGSIAIDSRGNLYLADAIRHTPCIRRVDFATGLIRVFASKSFDECRDPTVLSDLGHGPRVRFDRHDNLWILDERRNRLLRIDAGDHRQTIVAGSDSNGFEGDGEDARSAKFFAPRGITIDGEGNVFIADTSNWRVRRIDAQSGVIDTVAGTRSSGFSGDGAPAIEAEIGFPNSVAVAADGTLYVADHRRIRRIDATSAIISTIAGDVEPSLDDGTPATQAKLKGPTGITLDSEKNLYIADKDDHRVYRVDLATGVMEIVAGTGEHGLLRKSGPAREARLHAPTDVAMDAEGNLLIVDEGNHCIRRVDKKTRLISTLAGTGFRGFSGDGGPAAQAQLERPQGIALDASGNVFVADWGNRRIRRIDAKSGSITTVAGNGDYGREAIGGNALETPIGLPAGIAVAENGDIFFSQPGSILRLDANTNELVRIAGTGSLGFSGYEGEALETELRFPCSLVLDAHNQLYFADSTNDCIRRIDLESGAMTLVAGTEHSNVDFQGDRGFTSFPQGIALDNEGHLYISDHIGCRIMRLHLETHSFIRVAGRAE